MAWAALLWSAAAASVLTLVLLEPPFVVGLLPVTVVTLVFAVVGRQAPDGFRWSVVAVVLAALVVVNVSFPWIVSPQPLALWPAVARRSFDFVLMHAGIVGSALIVSMAITLGMALRRVGLRGLVARGVATSVFASATWVALLLSHMGMRVASMGGVWEDEPFIAVVAATAGVVVSWRRERRWSALCDLAACAALWYVTYAAHWADWTFFDEGGRVVFVHRPWPLWKPSINPLLALVYFVLPFFEWRSVRRVAPLFAWRRTLGASA